MKLTWIHPPQPPVSANKVCEVEKHLGVVFPSEYKDILACGDKIVPEKQYIVSNDESETFISALHQFLGYSDGQVLRCKEALLEHAVDYDRDLTALEKLIPFADDGDGWICFDYSDVPPKIEPSIVGYSLTDLSDIDEAGRYYVAHEFKDMLLMLREEFPK